MTPLISAEAREKASQGAMAHIRAAIALLEGADLPDLAQIAQDLADDIGAATVGQDS